MADFEIMITEHVNNLWEEYDVDCSGSLSKAETQRLYQAACDANDEIEFNEPAFEEAFVEFDKDGSGSVSKAEMIAFMKKVAGV